MRGAASRSSRISPATPRPIAADRLRQRAARFCAAVLPALAALAGGCDPPSTEAPQPKSALAGARPNIILITLCSFRYANMGMFGYERDTTPFLDALGRDGVVFENAMSASSWTKPATASIITGLTPNVHGLTDYYDFSEIRSAGFDPKRILPDDVVTIAECLREAGYATMTRNNNLHAGHYFNMSQGFDNDRRVMRNFDATRMLDDFEQWITELPESEPFFFFMLNADAHMPYIPDYEYYARFNRADPTYEHEYLQRYAVTVRQAMHSHYRQKTSPPGDLLIRLVDLYDAELAQLDDALSQLPDILRRTDRDENTWIVVTADHGERLGDPHGVMGHSGAFMEEQTVHIPLIFHGPGLPEGIRIPNLVRSIDIYPTLAEIAGAAAPDVLQGRSMAPLLTGESLPDVSAFASFRGTAHVLRSGAYKLHQLDEEDFQLFDIDADPDELLDIADEQPTVLAEMRHELETWISQEQAMRQFIDQGQTRELTPEAIEELEALGYLGD